MEPLTEYAHGRDNGGLDADIPLNVTRRDLFQACYTLLKNLCRKSRKAQSKLFPFITIFADHMGIEKLNVADTIAEIVRDNSRLCNQVHESFFIKFIAAIKVWGRKSRWLRLFSVFIDISGRPMKKNQDLVLGLMLEERDAVVDLTCDYSSDKCFLSNSDERHGMTRIELLIADDHHREVFSLLKYHEEVLNMLTLCAKGKNAENQGRISSEISLAKIMDNILYPDYDGQGRRDDRITADQIRFVQTPWLRLLVEVYLLNTDTTALAQVSGTDTFLPSDPNSQPAPSQDPSQRYLILEIGKCIDALADRLKGLDGSSYQSHPELLMGLKDSQGDDLGQHYLCVLEMAKASCIFFNRLETFVSSDAAHHARKVCAALRNAAVKLYSGLAKFQASVAGEDAFASLC